ncbi:hypothetical protein LUZ60_016149 [Juncus effusus]|nr:hypothetical protein LUZ60_016149 [Juncus effusus]
MKMLSLSLSPQTSLFPRFNNARRSVNPNPLFVSSKRRSNLAMHAVTRDAIDVSQSAAAEDSKDLSFPILVNSLTGKMGRAVAESALRAGLELVPVSFSKADDPTKTLEIEDLQVSIHTPDEREEILSAILKIYPDMIIIDYTVPDAVNNNAELYCQLGVPFVIGTTGGDRNLLYKTVRDSNNYAVISPQMGKQVVAFLAAMEIMADQFPGAFSGYKLEVMESHQATKLDTSGTAKAVISCFQKLGAVFDMNEIKMVRDPDEQVNMVGVPPEYLDGHAYHVYNLTSPDETVSFEFQHNVCGRSIYAEGTIDAAIFLNKMVKTKAEKKIYDMIDVLKEGNMR